MKKRKTGKWILGLGLSLLVSGMAQASVVYQDTFSTDGSLAGRAVETGTGSWQTHADMMTSGGVAHPAATDSAKVAALPFSPEAGMVYTLSASVNAISGSWLALGFLSDTNSSTISGNAFFFENVDTESPWMTVQAGGGATTFLGPGASENVYYSAAGSSGTLKVVLRTFATGWKATYSFNGTTLRAYTYSGSLNITHVAFGGSPISSLEIDDFMLESTLASTPLVYDDFSANDLSKWIDDTGIHSTITVSNETLTWVGAGGSWGTEFITSTKNDFDLSSATELDPSEIIVNIEDLIPRTDSSLDLEAFEVGWIDATGDNLMFLYSVRGSSSQNDAALHFKYNGTHVGSVFWFPTLPLVAGDLMICRWDGTTISIVRDRAGEETVLISTGFNETSFAGNASIYLGANFEGSSGASFVINEVSTDSIAGGYDAWVSRWGQDIGTQTDDPDNDGLENLYEYGLNGDPTNGLDRGIPPVYGIIDSGGSNVFGYVYPQLASDQNSGLIYSLELSTDLALGMWTNSEYVVTGTNVTGNTLDFVTNTTDTVDGEKFIRLVIETQ